MTPIIQRSIILLLWLFLLSQPPHTTDALSISDFQSALHHFLKGSPPTTSVQDLANTVIPHRRDNGSVLFAYTAKPRPVDDDKPQTTNTNTLILLHEFFGLTQSICDKADALAEDLQCRVICPDTFRGQSSTFIPKCIWLALTTPQERVNQDLEDVLQWASSSPMEKLAVMGFCYGGGKAIRFTTQKRPDAITVVCYGSPVTDVNELQKLERPVCGVFGQLDVQFPPPLLEAFRNALSEANVQHDVKVYDGVGHAFWSDMEQIRRGDQPQLNAYKQITTFLRKEFS
eukprot:CAMPEP_0202449276 /NCGR_PEP_ID=MMETSP1360-20130828/8018_1 /ASSEMBLY_ACC=CAM_ASM_000848 /TAXON_ID=515479 /ORGANISM="Licmophora paradoxa, Strain CCMP2313" /LENGTH=285 /DNA_ID=CAMNT_0049067143 /DNA_START=116 /DNA_END=970 /DNA_ORIENTATION=-